MHKVAVILIALVSAGAGVAGGHFVWRVPTSPQQLKLEQQRCERLLARTHVIEQPAAPSEPWTPARLESAIADAVSTTNSTERDTKMHDIFEHLDPADIPEIAAAVAKEMSTQTDASVLMRLVSTWRETDAEGALAFTGTLPPSSYRESLTSMCFASLVEDDPDSAEAYLKTLHKGAATTRLTGIFLEQRVHDDPEGAMAMAAQLPPGSSSREQGQLFLDWATDDPQAATAAALKLPPGSKRNDALSSVASTWVEQDAAAALEFFSKQGDKVALERALEQAVGSAGADHPDLVATYLDTIPPGAKRDDLLENLAIRWGGQDAANAKAWAMSLRDDNERDKALAGLVQSDEIGGRDLVSEIRDPIVRSRAAYTITAQLASTDPEAALQFVLEQPKSQEHELMVTTVMNAWAAEDPQKAAEALARMKNPPEQAMVGIARNWVGMDPKAALHWVESLPDGDARASVLSELTSSWAENDPQAAAAYADRQNDQSTVTETARAWAITDPQAALTWLESRHSSVGRDDGIDAAVAYWAASDEKRALEWATNLHAGDTKDRALHHIAAQSAYRDPANAMSIVMRMRPGDERTQQILATMDSWRASDADTANAWLAGAGLSQHELDAINHPEPDGGVAAVPLPSCVCPPASD